MLQNAKLYPKTLDNISKQISGNMNYVWVANRLGEVPLEHFLDDPSNICLVSTKEDKDNTKILGLIKFQVDNSTHQAYEIVVIGFGHQDPEFAKDLFKCINDMFYKRNLNSLVFTCACENPASRHWCKFIRMVNGHVVGVIKDYLFFANGIMSDEMIFQIMREDYISHIPEIKD